MKNTRKLVLTALFVAIGIILPMTLHGVPNGGKIFLPMHIPVLICGLICGPTYGIACGVLTPLISSFATGMPPAAILPGMLCELAVYGFMTGLIAKYVRTGKTVLDIYIALAGAMLLGRVTYGVLNTFVFMAGKYSMSAWVSAAFVTAVPGIAVQLVLIPMIVLGLKRAKLIER